jgi:hypothetical protein
MDQLLGQYFFANRGKLFSCLRALFFSYKTVYHTSRKSKKEVRKKLISKKMLRLVFFCLTLYNNISRSLRSLLTSHLI